MLRPITPFVEYAINYDYISKILCINKDKPEMSCNGKCQLIKNLEKQQEEDYNSLRISMEEYPIGFIKVTSVIDKNNFSITKTNKFFYKKDYTFLYSKSVFHPPTL